jgi:hypothetical protein
MGDCVAHRHSGQHWPARNLLPAAFKGDTIHFEITVSRPLAIGSKK